MSKFNISQKKVSDLQKRYEVKTNERELKNFLKSFAFLVLALMSVYHFYASGFGTIREILHRGIHISFVVGLVFIFYSWKKIDHSKKNFKTPFIDIVLSEKNIEIQKGIKNLFDPHAILNPGKIFF